MKFSAKWVVALAIVLFVGYVFYDTTTAAQVSCEVCLQFDGETVCRKGAGRTEVEARKSAQESTCGGNAQGMSESIACQNAVPLSVQCATG